jgi:hypothetical protein
MKTIFTSDRAVSLKSKYVWALAAMALLPLFGVSAQQPLCPAEKPVRCGGPSGTQWADSWACCQREQVCGIDRNDLHPFCQGTFESTQQSDDCFAGAFGDWQVCMLRFHREQLICEHDMRENAGLPPESLASCQEGLRIFDECALKLKVDLFNCEQQSDGWNRPSLPKPRTPAESSPDSEDDIPDQPSDDNSPSVPTELAPRTS